MQNIQQLIREQTNYSNNQYSDVVNNFQTIASEASRLAQQPIDF